MPEVVVTDNGPSFKSIQFVSFLKDNGITLVNSPPYHPASNGAAENAVKTFKNKFKMLIESGMSRHESLFMYLYRYYRSTPHCTTGCTPAELQIGRKFPTRLDLLRKKVHKNVITSENNQMKNYKGNRKVSFELNDTVAVKNYLTNEWEKGRVMRQESPVIFTVETEKGLEWKRHVDQIKRCLIKLEGEGERKNVDISIKFDKNDIEASENYNENDINNKTKDHSVQLDDKNFCESEKQVCSKEDPLPIRKSKRTPKPKERLNL